MKSVAELMQTRCHFSVSINVSFRQQLRGREREKFIHNKAHNQCYKQNKLMWQAARQESPIYDLAGRLCGHAHTNVYYSI